MSEKEIDKIVNAPEEKSKKVEKIDRMMDRTPGLEELQAAVLPCLLRYDGIKAPKHPHRVLGIDPGTSNLALAFIDNDQGSYWTSKIARPPNVSDPCSVMLYNEAVIARWISDFKPQVIFKEGIAHGMPHGVAQAGQIQYIVERLAILAGIPVVTVNNGTLRKYMKVPAGEETKGMMRLQVKNRFGVQFASADETDAYAVARTGIAILSGEIEINGGKKKK